MMNSCQIYEIVFGGDNNCISSSSSSFPNLKIGHLEPKSEQCEQSCDLEQVDLGQNNDFIKVNYYKPNTIGPREEEKLATFRKRAEEDIRREIEEDEHQICPKILELPPLPILESERKRLEEESDQGIVEDKKYRLCLEPPNTYWNQKLLGKSRFVEGLTQPSPNRLEPFRKNSSFTSKHFNLC